MATVTPWGRAEESTQITRGVMLYQARGHDIVRLSRLTLEKIPSYMRDGTHLRNDGWFEGEANTALPVLMFEREFKTHYDVMYGQPEGDHFVGRAHEIVKEYYPEIYKKWEQDYGKQSIYLNDIEMRPVLAPANGIKPRL